MASAKQEAGEEQYVLRVADPAVADKLRGLLREEQPSEQLQLSFPENGRQGILTLGGVEYPVHVLDLPTTVESYKTYDDVNLVKAGDVGQVLLVGTPSEAQQAEIRKAQEQNGAAAPVESLDGVTPPMHKARSRHLRPRLDVPDKVVSHVEEAIVDILDGNAPHGMVFEDVEEEYVVDPATNKGRWQQVSKEAAREAKAAADAAAAAADQEDLEE